MKSSHSGSNWRAVYRSWTWESYLNFRKASSKGDSCADLRKQVSCTHIFTHPSLEPTDRHRHQRSKENFNDWKRLVQENTFSLWNLHKTGTWGNTILPTGECSWKPCPRNRWRWTLFAGKLILQGRTWAKHSQLLSVSTIGWVSAPSGVRGRGWRKARGLL